MSRLAGRIGRLEARHGGCPGCAERAPIVGFSFPSRPWTPAPDEDRGPCPDCGQPRAETIIGLAFDWHPEGAEDPPAARCSGSVEQELKRDPPGG